MIKTTGRCIILALFLVALPSCQSQEPTAGSNAQTVTYQTPRMLEPGSPITKAYYESKKSIQASEDFIWKYPNEKDLCAGALLNMARLYAKQDEQNKAIDVYRKAIDEYGYEIVPDVNAAFTVREWALFRIGLLERDIGNRDEALQIFGKLMESSNFNMRTSSRIEYLATKQSHLKLRVAVSVPKKEFSSGESIPVFVSVHNPEKETVIFQCLVRIRRRQSKTYGAIAPRTEVKEITLQPEGEFSDTFVFTSKDGLEPGEWEIDCSLNGIPFDTNSEIIQIVE